MNRIEQMITRTLIVVVTTLSVAMLAGSVAINFANIIGRYVVHAPLEYAEEVMLYLMIGFVFLGGARVAAGGMHIRMDIFLRMMPERIQSVLLFASELLLVVACLVLTAFSWPTIAQLYDFDQRSVAADIPMYIPQAMVPIGLSTMAVFVSLRLLSGRWRERRHAMDH